MFQVILNKITKFKYKISMKLKLEPIEYEKVTGIQPSSALIYRSPAQTQNNFLHNF